MDTITTIQGDTWDTIAMRVYRNELRAQLLMETRENISLLDYQIFPSGIVVATPEPPDGTEAADLPEWRK